MVVFVGLDLQSCCLDTIGALKRYNAIERALCVNLGALFRFFFSYVLKGDVTPPFAKHNS